VSEEMESPRITVFYDGACPLCRREIGFYRRCGGADRIRWRDVAECDPEILPGGLTRDAALRRFHVETADGRLVSGAAAFAQLWSSLPRFRAIGWIARQSLLVPVLERLYVLFLRWRPALQKVLARS